MAPSAWVAVAIVATLLGCQRAAERAGPVPPGPSAAARVEIPSAGAAPVAAVPISTTQVCETPSVGQPVGGGGWPGPADLWRAVSPAFAWAQGRKKVVTAKSNGDVHLQMLNGLRYDFQAVGEFIAFQADAVEIQVRHQPFGTSKSVSVATAIAMKVGKDVVAVYGGDPVPLRVNRRAASLKDPSIRLSRDFVVQRQGNGFVVTSPDRFEVRILYGRYLDYIVTVCPRQPGPTKGLLGNVDGKPEDGLAPRDGTAVQLAGAGRDEFYRRLYRVFGDSWRISQEESLFDYEKGQTTKTFTDLSFPYDPDPAAALTAAQRQNAEAVCRKAGISERVALAECILDVGVTGDPAFADNNALVETMSARSREAQEGIGSWQCRGPVARPGWQCKVTGLTGARIGSSLTLRIETLQSGEKRVEALTCGPITDSLEAACATRTQGVNFQGARVVERFTLRSGELWEIVSRGQCRPAKAAGEPC